MKKKTSKGKNQQTIQKERIYIKNEDSLKPKIMINLDKSDFDDEQAKILGEELQYCSNVSQLSLNIPNSKMGSIGAAKLATNLYRCVELEKFSLNLAESNTINEQCLKNIIKQLQDCPKLTYFSLNFSGNQIGNKGFSNLITELNKCKNLKNMMLDFYNSDVNSFHEVGEELKKNKIIQRIDLNVSNSFHYTKQLTELGEYIAQCQSLIQFSLNISNNQERGQNPFGMIKALSLSKSLLKLSIFLSKCGIREQQDLQEFIESILTLKNIISLSLNLSYNSIHISGTTTLCQQLNLLPQLKNLSLYLMGLLNQENDIIDFGKALGCLKLSSLSLNLANNRISQKMTIEFLNNVFKNKGLLIFYLNLKYNKDDISYKQLKLIAIKQKKLLSFDIDIDIRL